MMKKKSRYRRSNLELAGFSRQHLRAIKRISDMAQVQLNRVFTDVIEIGIAAVASRYQPMIEMEQERQTRAVSIQKLLNGQENENVEVGQQEIQATGQGISKESKLLFQRPLQGNELVNVEYGPVPVYEGTSKGPTPINADGTIYRPSDDVVGPGHETETLEAAGSDDSESIVFGE